MSEFDKIADRRVDLPLKKEAPISSKQDCDELEEGDDNWLD